MIPTYVIHYDKLVERREYLEKMLPHATFVTQYRRDYLEEEQLRLWYDPSPKRWIRECEGLYREIPPYQELNKGIISCSIAHIYTWRKAWGEYMPCLILEDDAILCNNFEEEYNEAVENITKLKGNWDVVFIGGAFPHEICKTLAKKEGLLLKDHPASNTVCAYIIHPEAAKRLYDYVLINKFTLPIDFAMNYAMKELSMKVWHVNPYIIREGTSAGFYKSSQVRV